MADHTKMEESQNKSIVLCDACHGNQKLSAVKSCLQCVTSFCETHLENHKTAARLIKHKLIDPVENLEDYICVKHEKPLELFCRDDRTFLCPICIEIGHNAHNIVPIEQESGDQRAQLKKTQAEVKVMIQDRIKKTEEIKSSEKVYQTNNVKILTALIERCQSELLEVIEQKQKAENQAEELIKELEQEITELKRRDTELEQLSHTEDHLHLLQMEPLNCRLYYICHCTCVSFAVNVILDPKTAYPKLILSKDGKLVKHSGSWRDVPNNPERFDSSACVLGKDGFSCGKIYYEAEVGEKTEWDLGVARESIQRKGKVTVCPENGFWCIWLRNGGEYVANESCPVPLSLKDKPQKVGVFVDYEEGLVSFYNVGSKTLIYSFTGQSFTEKIYPFFSPCNKRGDVNTKPLIIY
ncbi:E3 ubiquitin-protein ligase TRIM39-like [Onychostoma macrolepis]|uniref:E3 ubiquitin-protein ligase TRIM39-like n=1 Tax=Onychostoma macrolepis TaxID=369639 RepID=UPI00272C9406|nr:E3 ubiquitin-protein ligase TRIM39-like [Onychostoma macrolepis]